MEEEKQKRDKNANLKPIKKGELSTEEAKARGRKGGIRSGISRRNKRDAKEAATYLLGLAAKGKLDANLSELGIPVDERTNMIALVARLFTLAMAGNLDATDRLLKIAGYDSEENRKERESIASDLRREKELNAKIEALVKNSENSSAAINMDDEDGRNDVVIYMPQLDNPEDCELPPEENTDE